MLAAAIPFIVLLVGLLMWGFAANPKVQKAGEYMFFCGCFVLTWHFAGETVQLLRR
jgi:Na+/phosphate symporter